MQPTPGFAVRTKARAAAQLAWSGFIQVLTAPDRAPAWQPRAPWQRRALYSALGAATLVLAAASLADGPTSRSLVIRRVVHGFPGMVHQDAAGQSGPLVLAALALLAVLPVPLAVRYPLLAWRIAWLAFLVTPVARAYWWGGWPWYPVQLPILLAVLCAAGFRHQRAVLWWMWGLTLAVWWLWSGTDRPDILAHLLGTAALTAVIVAVDSISSRRSAQQALTILAGRAELKQAQLTVLEERARIARELHDVVAHHLSLIAVRAESAPYRFDDLTEPVRAEFSALSFAAHDALTDMRRLLGVLRQDQSAARVPQPQLADLPSLIGTARQAGVPVELSVSADLTGVPTGIGVCAYRIVQESLSNAGRHAPGAPVRVSVGADAGTVVLQVTNGPPGPADTWPGAALATATEGGSRTGHGLPGMRERVALLGGSLSAGRAPDGGFVVSAVLPLHGAM